MKSKVDHEAAALFPRLDDSQIVESEEERDETAYLLRSPTNRERLLKGIADIEQNRNVVVPDL
jgi:PHD/YefM family antitoxin component YafN of YafNO toxin-antitoxin module